MRYVLDASALLAVIRTEPHSRIVRAAIAETAFISTINIAETSTRLHRLGMGSNARSMIAEHDLAIVPLTSELALVAGELESVGRPLGLSLADRCCLATAAAFDAVALTTDRAWLDLPEPWSQRVRCVRED